jgi:hypothetical protein
MVLILYSNIVHITHVALIGKRLPYSYVFDNISLLLELFLVEDAHNGIPPGPEVLSFPRAKTRGPDCVLLLQVAYTYYI